MTLGSELFAAANTGNIAGAVKLLDQGVDVNYRHTSREDRTEYEDRHDNALHIAVSWGHTEVAGLLLDRGVDIEATDTAGGGAPR